MREGGEGALRGQHPQDSGDLGLALQDRCRGRWGLGKKTAKATADVPRINQSMVGLPWSARGHIESRQASGDRCSDLEGREVLEIAALTCRAGIGWGLVLQVGTFPAPRKLTPPWDETRAPPDKGIL